MGEGCCSYLLWDVGSLSAAIWTHLQGPRWDRLHQLLAQQERCSLGRPVRSWLFV